MKPTFRNALIWGVLGVAFGKVPAMRAVFRAIGWLARRDITVKIEGAYGTVARASHRHNLGSGAGRRHAANLFGWRRNTFARKLAQPNINA